MSRRAIEKSDSLDMLLDTMCNTLGGIILISLLIALFSHSAPSQKTKSAQSLPADSHDAINLFLSLQAECNASAARLTLLREIDESSNRLASVKAAAELNDQQRAAIASDLERAAQTTKDLQITKGTLIERISAIEAERAALSNRTVVEIHPPLLEEAGSDRERCDIIVVGDRIYPIRLFVNQVPQRNETSIHWIPQGDNFVLQPIPGAGFDGRGFDSYLATLSAKRHVPHLFLYPDSFAIFVGFRQALVERGFGYDIDFCPQSQPIRSVKGANAPPTRTLAPPRG